MKIKRRAERAALFVFEFYAIPEKKVVQKLKFFVISVMVQEVGKEVKSLSLRL